MVSQIVDAVYEGGVFRLLSPLSIYLEEGERVMLTILEKIDLPAGNEGSQAADNEGSTHKIEGDEVAQE